MITVTRSFLVLLTVAVVCALLSPIVLTTQGIRLARLSSSDERNTANLLVTRYGALIDGAAAHLGFDLEGTEPKLTQGTVEFLNEGVLAGCVRMGRKEGPDDEIAAVTGAPSLTVSYWVNAPRRSEFASALRLVTTGSDSRGDFAFGIDPEKGVFLERRSPQNGESLQSTSDPSYGLASAWTHVAVTITGTHAVLFVDGERVGAFVIAKESDDESGDWKIVIDGGFDASIDELLVFDRHLLPSEYAVLASADELPASLWTRDERTFANALEPLLAPAEDDPDQE